VINMLLQLKLHYKIRGADLFLEVIMGDHPEIEAAVAKSFKSATILKLVLTLCWVAIRSKAILDEIAATASLTFAPGLFDLLISQTASTIAELKKLPTDVLPTRL